MSCPSCFKGGIKHEHEPAKGKEEVLYGKKSYIVSAPPTSTSQSVILFLTDAFGLDLINNKILADQYAAKGGFKVIMPDVIPGGPASISLLNNMHDLMEPVAWLDIMGQLRRIGAAFGAIFGFVPFLYRAGPPSAFPAILAYARAVKADLPPGAKLGVAGFCWGGWGSTNLCKEPAVEGGSERLIDAQFCAHPSALKTPDMIVDAVAKFKVPYSLAIGDKDMVMSHKATLETEAALKKTVGEPEAHDYEVKIYPGCTHGFGIRAFPDNKVETEAADEALIQAVEWYKRYL